MNAAAMPAASSGNPNVSASVRSVWAAGMDGNPVTGIGSASSGKVASNGSIIVLLLLLSLASEVAELAIAAVLV